MTGLVIDAAVAAAQEVPRHLLELGAAAITDASCWSPSAQTALTSASPAAHYREHARRIGVAWREESDLSGSAVSVAILAAVGSAEAVRAEHQASLVWTGPSTEALGLRSTRAVLDTLVAQASDTLVLVSFASYRVADLVAALSDAAARGVAISFILETSDDSYGGLTVDAARAFTSLAGKARFYRWPAEARGADFSTSARLHAKCVIADRSAALVTSANLTEAGINDNIELGVLLEAGPLPATLHDHFALMIEDGTLEEMTP